MQNNLKLSAELVTVNMNDTIPNQPAKLPAVSIGFDSDTAYISGENLLVTASIGLYHWRGKFYVQVITAHNENNYIMEIPSQLALTINVRDCIEITKVKDENTTTILDELV